ncbi:hypothetical protein J2W14_002148 [Pseudarthrobacter oxydans]|uniref:hypothetical protein n=1 Tax=Pseudarthrobacter oxydans TaxID=1671 RepID=UPI0027881FD8|nr:hypothetical protein [Pseudarthrobacter oxydans]MDP9982756.1 hypothetical protein [Pseudarthrobacter oxydans]
MGNTLAYLDRKGALLFAIVFGLAALGIAVAAIGAVYFGLVSTPLLNVPLTNLVTPALGEGNGEVIKAAYATADVQPASLTATERFLLLGSGLLGSLAGLASAATLGLISWSVYRGTGFGRQLARAVGISGLAVMTWGLLGPLMNAMAYHSVLDRITLLPQQKTGAFFLMEFDVWPVAVGLGAATLASMFETGRRQQLELDGLI